MAAGGVGRSMGDWEVGRSDEQDTRLRVRPGYGDIRKICFMCPDYAAILSYSLSLGPSHLSLSLNDSPVPGHILATLQEVEVRHDSYGQVVRLLQPVQCSAGRRGGTGVRSAHNSAGWGSWHMQAVVYDSAS